MLCGLATAFQSSYLYVGVFDPLSFQQDGSLSSEVDVDRGEVADVVVTSKVVVVDDEVADLLREIDLQIVALEQDAVVEHLALALYLTLHLGM